MNNGNKIYSHENNFCFKNCNPYIKNNFCNNKHNSCISCSLFVVENFLSNFQKACNLYRIFWFFK